MVLKRTWVCLVGLLLPLQQGDAQNTKQFCLLAWEELGSHYQVPYQRLTWGCYQAAPGDEFSHGDNCGEVMMRIQAGKNPSAPYLPDRSGPISFVQSFPVGKNATATGNQCRKEAQRHCRNLADYWRGLAHEDQDIDATCTGPGHIASVLWKNSD